MRAIPAYDLLAESPSYIEWASRGKGQRKQERWDDRNPATKASIADPLLIVTH